jgi:hypothetical protein
MGSKRKNPTATTGGNLPPVRIGSRVRCTDDGVAGRLVWANGTSVKIQWDEGEQVSWKRDTLATRPLEILDTDGARTRSQSLWPQTPPRGSPQQPTRNSP